MIEFEPRKMSMSERISFVQKHGLLPEDADKYRSLTLEAKESIDSFVKYARYSENDIINTMERPENVALFNQIIRKDLDNLGIPQACPAEIVSLDLETICAYQCFLVIYLEYKHKLQFYSRLED